MTGIFNSPYTSKALKSRAEPPEEEEGQGAGQERVQDAINQVGLEGMHGTSEVQGLGRTMAHQWDRGGGRRVCSPFQV